jgi:hypothetical protein
MSTPHERSTSADNEVRELLFCLIVYGETVLLASLWPVLRLFVVAAAVAVTSYAVAASERSIFAH